MLAILPWYFVDTFVLWFSHGQFDAVDYLLTATLSDIHTLVLVVLRVCFYMAQ
jgi:hypothetical protein